MKPDAFGVLSRQGVVDPLDARPVDRRKAHGAGLAGREDLAPLQVDPIQRPAGFPDRLHLGVGRGVLASHDPVPRGAHDPPRLHDHGAEGAALPPLNRLAREARRLRHGVFHRYPRATSPRFTTMRTVFLPKR
jgi:hypothetical protein